MNHLVAVQLARKHILFVEACAVGADRLARNVAPRDGKPGWKPRPDAAADAEAAVYRPCDRACERVSDKLDQRRGKCRSCRSVRQNCRGCRPDGTLETVAVQAPHVGCEGADEQIIRRLSDAT